MGAKGDPDANCAYRKTIAFKNDDRKPAPIPLEECPWCGTKFNSHSFDLVPSRDRPEVTVQPTGRELWKGYAGTRAGAV